MRTNARSFATSRFAGDENLRLDLRRLEKNDSDHQPVLFSVGEDVRIDALSWNVCFRYAIHAERRTVNNGFGRGGESVSDYRARLSRTAAALEKMTRELAPTVVVIQEAARKGDALHGVIDRALRDRLGPLGYTVFSSGELVTAVRGRARRISLPVDLKQQAGTMDALLLEEQKAIAVNVHWRWSAKGTPEEQATRDDLRAVVRHLQQLHPGLPIIFAGDLNCLPANVAATGARIEDVVGDVGRIVPPPGPTNVRWNSAKNLSEMTYADFALCVPA